MEEKLINEEMMNLNGYEQSIEYVNEDSEDVFPLNEEISENKSKKTKWTEEQRKIVDISNVGKNLLVSASAGSGKTAVMTQRIVNLVCELKIPISNFLIVTFTTASAQEMKLRIIKKLKELPQTDFIVEQIDSVSTSDISDLHSFYSRLVSTYFYEVEIDPSYHIIDDTESTFLKNRAIKRLFEQKEKNNDEKYYRLFDCFQVKRNDDYLKEIIFSFNNYLDSHIDGEKWFFETIDKSYETNLDSNICANYLIDYFVQKTKQYAFLCEDFSKKAMELGSEKHAEYFDDISSRLKVFSKTKSFVTNAENAMEFSIPRYPKIKEEFKFLDEEAKNIQALIKNEMEKKWKKIFVCCDENEIIFATKNAKQLLLDLFAITQEYSNIYSNLKKEINGLDFNDLERFAYKILSNESICNSVKNKYKFIFVDEYQDVNALQEKIISMISSENNRFMVGDLKQSIYRFRLCDPEIFLEKYKTYSSEENSEVIKLNKNFRSDKKILKFVDKIFSKTMTEDFGGINYATESVFTAGDDNVDEPQSVNLCYIDTTNEITRPIVSGEIYSVKNHINQDDEETRIIIAEARYVAKKISEIKAEALKKGENVLNSDFAVLVFTRGVKISEFIEELKNLGVPVSSDEKNNLMKKNYIEEIVNFIKYVVFSRDDYLLFKVLKSRLFDFSNEEIAELRKLSSKVNFFETIKFENIIQNENLKSKVIDFNNTVKKYREIASMMTIKDFSKLIVDDFKIENINLLSQDGVTRNEHIQKFISSLPKASVNEFLINYEQFDLEVENECGGDAVKIMTVHKSKGLQFKYVFIINTAKNINFESSTGKVLFNKNFGVGIKSYDNQTRIAKSTIALDAIKIYERQKIAEEQQRLLYVALTRAENKLFVVCSAKEKDITNNFPSVPTKYIDWFKPIIFEKLNDSQIDPYIEFECYKPEDFSGENKMIEKQMLFSKTDVNLPNEFMYKFSESVNIPLKNSVSKILKMRDDEKLYSEIKQGENQDFSYEDKKIKEIVKQKQYFDDDYDDRFEIQENSIIKLDDFESTSSYKNSDKLNVTDDSFFARRGTAYHKVLEEIDFYNLDDIDAQLKTIQEKLSKEDNESNSLVDYNVIKKIVALPIFLELKNYKVFKEREFFARSKSKLISNKAIDDDYIIMQGVIDLLAISEEDMIVLDYKTGKYSESKLDKYKFQLDFYSSVCKKIAPNKKIRKIICFIDEQKIINL